MNIIASSGLDTFVQAYVSSDLVGRVIYLALIALSIISWTLLIYKWWLISHVERESNSFKRAFVGQKHHPLAISFERKSRSEIPNAFSMIYTTLRERASDFIQKNATDEGSECLTAHDFSILETHAASMITSITHYLDRNLYLLSTIVTLAPFLGLLGTVYGILITFGMLAPETSGSTQQILGGLSLALTTTVIGLVNAIPALIGYNMLKNKIAHFDHEMERFATEVLSIFDSHYRKRG